mmetsp:Transcript_55523/g.129212  ORF Transcript_55523/g.129212 Transcript_55523/m.129212 type:complete len:305 (+) Transcript_55523:479-1393(+)
MPMATAMISSKMATFFSTTAFCKRTLSASMANCSTLCTMYFCAKPATSHRVSSGTSTCCFALLFSGSSSAASTASSFHSFGSASSVSSFSSLSLLSLSSSTASSYSSSPLSSASGPLECPVWTRDSSCQSCASTRPVYSNRKKTRIVTHFTFRSSTLPDWNSCMGCSNMAAKASLAAASTTLCAPSWPSARTKTTSSKRLLLNRCSYMSTTPSSARSAACITGSSSFRMPFHWSSLAKFTLHFLPSTEVMVPTSPGLTTPHPHLGYRISHLTRTKSPTESLPFPMHVQRSGHAPSLGACSSQKT